jgi:hypothetical protein
LRKIGRKPHRDNAILDAVIGRDGEGIGPTAKIREVLDITSVLGASETLLACRLRVRVIQITALSWAYELLDGLRKGGFHSCYTSLKRKFTEH